MQFSKRNLLIVFFCGLLTASFAQPSSLVISGPMTGQVEMRTAIIWIELSPEVKSATIRYWKKSEPRKILQQHYHGQLGREFNPAKFLIGGLDYNSNYEYDFLLNGKPSAASGDFTTKDLWQWRKPPPDFTFLTGSCAYFNEARFDRPGKPYGGDSTIFETMARNPAAFMLWLGDNWYTREVDYSSVWGLWYRASHDRRLPVLQKFWQAMPHYAIWDDHDFGPDDSDGSYVLKDSSRAVFMSYWGNPSYGQDGKGIYTQFSFADADFFLTDDRYFRSSDLLIDSVNGMPNPEKRFFGRQQLDWLENALTTSDATFKIIAVGSQVLNQLNHATEGLDHYPVEFEELLKFLDRQKINGVIFLTGDRHHSEIIEYKRANNYSLYDITVSPLTSGISRVKGAEINNPARVANTLVEEQNFARISVKGKTGERIFRVEFIDTKGAEKASWEINQSMLHSK
jgi:alkaline phosphatase D